MANPSCLACGSPKTTPFASATDVEYFTLKERFAYHRCTACGSLSIDPVPADLLPVIYPSTYYSYSEHGEGLLDRVKTRLDALLFRRILKKIPGEDLHVLDVGGGNGWLLDVLLSVDRRVSRRQIVDIDPTAGVQATRKGHRYFQGRIEDFDSVEGFDLILMLNLLEHVADPREVLRKARALLKPNGLLLLKTPNYDALDARIFRERNWGGYHCPRHWVLFSMSSLERLVSSLGFGIEFKRYTQGGPFWTWSVLHCLHERGWVRLSAERPAPRHPLSRVLTGLFAAFDFMRMPLGRTSQMFFLLRKS